jgi:hypothetical protein
VVGDEEEKRRKLEHFGGKCKVKERKMIGSGLKFCFITGVI